MLDYFSASKQKTKLQRKIKCFFFPVPPPPSLPSTIPLKESCMKPYNYNSSMILCS